MPGEEVQQRAQRLTDQTKADPEDHVTSRLTVNTPDFLNHVRQSYQRDLYHHAEEGHADDVVRRHTDKQLVQHARDEEDDDLRHRRRHSSPDKRRVDVSTHEVGDRLVPRRPVSADRADIPPGPVELAVAKGHDLGECVERGLEEGEETAEPAEDADGGELHDALEDGGHIQFQKLVEGVLQEWGGVLGAGDPHDDAQAEDLQQVTEDEAPADVRGPWVDGLVDERWCPPEVAHVLEVDVLGVWAGLVE